jgi:hypothetical protein
MSTDERRPRRQGAKCYRVCIRCETRRQIPWHLRLADDHQDDTYICKFCKPKLDGPRYRDFDPAQYGRGWHLQHRYGITATDYDRMLAEQDGRCRICRKLPVKNRLHVDHDRACCPGPRSCGKCIRGLLCVSCNSKLEWWLNFQAEIAAYLPAAPR